MTAYRYLRAVCLAPGGPYAGLGEYVFSGCLRARADDGEGMGVDLLTCGTCRQQFPLSQFLQFVWHKVLGCADQTPPPRRDDVITDRRPCDVTRSPRPPGEDDVSSMTSRAGDIGKFRSLSTR